MMSFLSKFRQIASLIFTKQTKDIAKIIIFGLVLFLLGTGFGYYYFGQTTGFFLKQDIYLKFLDEVYGIIQNNYWEKLSEEQLSELFRSAAEKITQQRYILPSPNKLGVLLMVRNIMRQMKPDEKKEFVVQLSDTVLKNLYPFQRSSLYTTKEAKELAQMVNNINPETGTKNPTIASKPIPSPVSSSKISSVYTPEILYLRLQRFSPSTLEEFQKEVEKADKIESLNTLILDLRGNIGGSIDILPYFLGPFIGNNQYAYEFFSRGEYIPVKTKTGWLPALVRYKKVIILIDENTQSTAELFASVLKKYNVGVLIGRRTKGWGTVERIFPIKQQIDPNETYSVFLVHSLTLREDGQPIEENGVEPTISIDDPDWKNQLFAYFHWQELAQVVEEIWENPPFK